jgi:methylated-DNA-[protein]-cysteine S-methyltransferase
MKTAIALHTCLMDTPLGSMRAFASGDALTGLWFAERQRYAPPPGDAADMPGHAVFRALRAWLAAYFAGENPSILGSLTLAPRGTPFRETVWAQLRAIPYGCTATYGELAQFVLRQGGVSARAVGGAVGHNPISILIPCHRVIGADGSLTGYGGGLDRKEHLLRLEGALRVHEGR